MFYKDSFDAPIHTTSECLLKNILSPKAICDDTKSALDAITSPVMLTDKNYVITFVNIASLQLLAQINHELGLQNRPLSGVRIEDWYEHPAYSRLAYTLTFTPLTNARMEFSGAFVDWGVAKKTSSPKDFLETALCLNA